MCFEKKTTRHHDAAIWYQCYYDVFIWLTTTEVYLAHIQHYVATCKKSLNIPKGYKEVVNRRTDNISKI